jgi:UDP-glucose 4-epimerase
VKVLITGAAGFIGSHLLERFQRDGHEVWGIDNFQTGSIGNVPTHPPIHSLGQFAHGDIGDRAAFYDFANQPQPELVVHCAASYSDPNTWHRDVDTNVAGTINVINVARHHGAKLVYFQTALPPISSYAISKIAGEQYIRLSEVPSLIFRLANIYGPRNLSGPIPTFFKRLSAGEPCTVVDTRRDLVYIDDLVDLVMFAIRSGGVGKYDVCSGSDYSIAEMYTLVAWELGAKPLDLADIQPAPKNDVLNMELDPSPAMSQFGWRSSTPITEGIVQTVAWYQEHGVGETFTHLALKG